MKKVLCVAVFLALMAGTAGAVKIAPVTDGVYRLYYPSGALQKEENYRNKDLSGQSSEYYENGKLKSTVGYAAGLREGVGQTYYETGILKSEGTYRNGALQGEFREYDKSGNLNASKNYKDGVLNGIAKTYYPSGAVSKQVYYKKAVLDGTAVEFAEDGTPKAEESYQDGILIERRDIAIVSNLATKRASAAPVVLPEIKKNAPASAAADNKPDVKADDKK